MPLFRLKKLRLRYRRRPKIDRNPWSRLMLRWVDRSFKLRPHQVGYYDEHTPLTNDRGNTMLLACMKAERLWP
jgi:hypothetical protein